MSIVTMKKKTAAKYNNMSVGSPAFSLNGTHRSQGYVGQNIISRSLPRTSVKSHGGCCGTFQMRPVIISSVHTTEDTTVVKPSCIGTRGMIETKYAMPYYNRPYPCSIVKPDATMNINDQSSYVANLTKKTITFITAYQNIFKDADSSGKNIYFIALNYNGTVIFNGIFLVNTNSFVTNFYDITNPIVDILTNYGFNASDNYFNTTTNTFSSGGVEIKHLPYFNRIITNANSFNLYYDGDFNVVALDTNGNIIQNFILNNMVITYHKNTNNECKQSLYQEACRSISLPGSLPKSLQHTKDPSTFTSVSQSSYISSLDKKCSQNDVFTISTDGIYGKKQSFGYPAGCQNK